MPPKPWSPKASSRPESTLSTDSSATSPATRRFPKAQMLIGLAAIDQKSASSDFAGAIKEIRDFVNDNVDKENFDAMKAEVATRAGAAALGAATMAGKSPATGRDLLVTSREALTLFSSYSPKGCSAQGADRKDLDNDSQFRKPDPQARSEYRDHREDPAGPRCQEADGRTATPPRTDRAVPGLCQGKDDQRSAHQDALDLEKITGQSRVAELCCRDR